MKKRRRHLPRPQLPGSAIGATSAEIREWACAMIERRKQNHRPGQEAVLEMKRRLLERDGNNPVCYWCQCSFPKTVAGEIDFFYATLEHIVPLYLGGKHEIHNCAFACKKCNNGREHE